MDKQILVIDAIIDLVLGLLLVVFPHELIKIIGAPTVESAFYPSLLGAVLFGVGVALLVECFSGPNGPYGLGLAGAIAINLCGGIALGLWIVFGKLSLPPHGQVLLWALVGLLVVVSLIELVAQKKH